MPTATDYLGHVYREIRRRSLGPCGRPVFTFRSALDRTELTNALKDHNMLWKICDRKSPDYKRGHHDGYDKAHADMVEEGYFAKKAFVRAFVIHNVSMVDDAGHVVHLTYTGCVEAANEAWDAIEEGV